MSYFQSASVTVTVRVPHSFNISQGLISFPSKDRVTVQFWVWSSDHSATFSPHINKLLFLTSIFFHHVISTSDSSTLILGALFTTVKFMVMYFSCHAKSFTLIFKIHPCFIIVSSHIGFQFKVTVTVQRSVMSSYHDATKSPQIRISLWSKSISIFFHQVTSTSDLCGVTTGSVVSCFSHATNNAPAVGAVIFKIDSGITLATLADHSNVDVAIDTVAKVSLTAFFTHSYKIWAAFVILFLALIFSLLSVEFQWCFPILIPL